MLDNIDVEFAGVSFKGIVLRDFEWLQMILMDRIVVPDVPLEIYSFLNFQFNIVLEFLGLQRIKLFFIAFRIKAKC